MTEGESVEIGTKESKAIIEIGLNNKDTNLYIWIKRQGASGVSLDAIQAKELEDHLHFYREKLKSD